ncbi:MAG: response regulator [Agarilytica sp.]
MKLSPEETRHLISIVKLYRSWMYGSIKENADELDPHGKAFLANRLGVVSSAQQKLEAMLAAGGAAVEETAKPSEPGISIENARVLIADDDDVTRELVGTILEDIGFKNMDSAENGQVALERILESGPYHLIICDWRMPELNGLEVHQRAKEANKLDDSIFILLTAIEDEVLAARAERQGISIYATKPIDADEFEANIRESFG